MSRKGIDRGKANLALRLLMYFRMGLYNALWSISQSSVMDQHGGVDGPQIRPNLHDTCDRDEME